MMSNDGIEMVVMSINKGEMIEVYVYKVTTLHFVA